MKDPVTDFPPMLSDVDLFTLISGLFINWINSDIFLLCYDNTMYESLLFVRLPMTLSTSALRYVGILLTCINIIWNVYLVSMQRKL